MNQNDSDFVEYLSSGLDDSWLFVARVLSRGYIKTFDPLERLPQRPFYQSQNFVRERAYRVPKVRIVKESLIGLWKKIFN